MASQMKLEEKQEAGMKSSAATKDESTKLLEQDWWSFSKRKML